MPIISASQANEAEREADAGDILGHHQGRGRRRPAAALHDPMESRFGQDAERRHHHIGGAEGQDIPGRGADGGDEEEGATAKGQGPGERRPAGKAVGLQTCQRIEGLDARAENAPSQMGTPVAR